MNNDQIKYLQEAIKQTPGNLPLRKLLCNALFQNKQYEEAEIEYKQAIELAPQDQELKIGLAKTFHQNGKTSLATVIVEELVDSGTAEPQTWLFYARLLYQSKQFQQAKEAYDIAVANDPSVSDSIFESQINVALNKNNPHAPPKIKLGGEGTEGGDQNTLEIERPKINFEDVGGMQGVKDEIRKKIIYPLEHQELYRAYGKKIGGGILLFGPPGCGKTLVARATAGEVNSNFIAVGISDILDMYLGQSERNLHAIFQKARSLKPCVLYFDEVDALGAKRSDMKQSAGRHIINQFLAELDGVEYSNDGVLILASTNTPWHLDTAFRRPGRFDRIIFVPPPDDAAREAILKIKLKDKPVGNIAFDRIVKKTKEFSGADLEAVIDIAIEAKLDEAMSKGSLVPLMTKDLEKAVQKHRPSTKEWFGTAKNYALFSNEAGIYDDILRYLNLKK